jgi:uncharacterized protein YcsI (UPF0317 family)
MTGTIVSAGSTPAEARTVLRAGRWTGITTGLCAGYVQANLAILPAELATDFAEFCRANPRPLPLLEMTEPGVPDRLRSAPGADLRTDLPRYRVYRRGQLDDEPTSIESLWRDDLVGFLLGCSFSAEEALRDAGVRLRHLEEGSGVPMYRTSLRCQPVGRFSGPVVVSMRAIAEGQVVRADRVTARLPFAHGAPLHVGDPAQLGINDLASPDWGDPLPPAPGEVPVFWACGVTPQAVFAEVRPELAITHAPGHMFLTDLRVSDLVDAA